MTQAETIAAMQQWCMDNYNKGADTMVECWTESDYEELFAFEGKAKTAKQAWATLRAIVDVYADRQADSRNSVF
jgi:hypothetical protein